MDPSCDDEGSQSGKKRRRLVFETCIICSATAPMTDLATPRDENSWKTLLRAAEIQDFVPITNYAKDESVPCVYYHTTCRNTFTLKKTLDNILAKGGDATSGCPEQRNSMRNPIPSASRVYDPVCMFCQKCKYVKNTHSREPVVQCLESRADERIRQTAIQKLDTDIIAVVSRDIVAAEAHYHKSCYHAYTREAKELESTTVDSDPYSQTENEAYQMLFSYVRNNVFVSPRVVKMTELTLKLTEYMQSLGIQSVKRQTKNHIRRRLESEFGDAICVINDKGKLLLLPDVVTREDLAKENSTLIDKLNVYRNKATDVNMLTRTAVALRDEVKASVRKQSWPPLPEELDEDYLPVPDALVNFYHVLIAGEDNVLSDRTHRLAHSFAQDCVFGITGGRQKSNKHTIMPWSIKTVTGNCELIKGINRLGHGISYSQLSEIETAFALQKLSVDDQCGVAIPSNIQPCVPTTVAYDNIDRLEETLSGGGTSHRVNGIIVQHVVDTVHPQPMRVADITRKDKRRSIAPTNPILPPYNAGDKAEPPVIDTMDINSSEIIEESRTKNLVWILARLHDRHNQTVTSWTGHNILTRDHISVTKDTIGYLPTINAPATQMATIFEVLNQVLMIKDQLDITDIVCVFDQAMYEKAIDVSWRHAERFQHIVFRMGVFHTCCNLMGTIGKRFSEAGLRDLAVESGIVAEGSVENVMTGKKYNRAVRFHKLLYEALLRLLWKDFYPWLEEHHADHLSQLRDTNKLVEELHSHVSHETLDNILQDPSCMSILHLFDLYMDHLRNDNGPLSEFWMSYIDMVEILLGLIRASREGNWLMHLVFIREMIPWSFAYDKRNYAKYLTVYFGQMGRLQIEHVDSYNCLMNAGLSVQIGEKNPFGRIPVDQTVEETVNKDTQTAGGTNGFSLKPGAVSKYYLTAEHRSASLRQFRTMVDMGNKTSIHHDIEPSRIAKDEADVESLVELMEDNWKNPFENCPSDLISISTGTTATSDIAADLLGANKIGKKSYDDFKEKRLGTTKSVKFHDVLPKQNLKTFNNLKEKKKAGKSNRETAIKADYKLFGRIILIASSRNLHIKDVLKHPLGPLPWALANYDGTIKKTSKASLARHLEKKVAAAIDIPTPSACLIDGMSMLHKTNGENKTFGEVSEQLLISALNTGRESERVDIIFDVYKDTSIKNAERNVRRGTGVLYTNISHGHKIHQWRKLLACSASKTALIEFLVIDWQKETLRTRLGTKELFVAFDGKCIRLTKDDSIEVPSLNSNQEEADTRLILHAKHAAPSCESVVVVSEDTDVLIISLAFDHDIDSNIFMKCGTQTRTRFINVTKLAHALGDSVCKALIGLHAFTGCDSVSSFAGIGKVAGLKLLTNPSFQEMFAQLGNDWMLSDELATKLQEFTCRLYAGRSTISTVNELRYQLFRAKNGEVEGGQLPPCEDCLRLHTLRANYQAGIWCRSMEAYVDKPSPDGHGWSVHPDGNLDIKWMNGSPALDTILEFLSCKCPRVCKLPQCVCIANGLQCTDMCKLSPCSNMADEIDGELDSSDDDEHDRGE